MRMSRRAAIFQSAIMEPKLSYTGEMEIFRSKHPMNGKERFYAVIKSSGTLSSDIPTELEIFLVNGGKAGSPGTWPGVTVQPGPSGGIGGLTKNTKVQLFGSVALAIGPSGGETKWGDDVPGAAPTNIKRPFNGDVAPFSDIKLAGDGGKGGNYSYNPPGIMGDVGVDGGGNGGRGAYLDDTIVRAGTLGTAGTANTGGGGGSGGSSPNNLPTQGGDGGTGVIYTRWGDWSS